jgi:hypothetical protein
MMPLGKSSVPSWGFWIGASRLMRSGFTRLFAVTDRRAGRRNHMRIPGHQPEERLQFETFSARYIFSIRRRRLHSRSCVPRAITFSRLLGLGLSRADLRDIILDGCTMGKIGITIRAGFHWLTAAMTLFASFPAFECHCAGVGTPSAHPVAAGATCCCGQVCGAGGSDTQAGKPEQLASPSSAEEEPCCCHRRDAHKASTSPEPSQPTRTCKRVAVPSVEYLSSGSRTLIASPVVCELLRPVQPLYNLDSTRSPAKADWLLHPPAPPPELSVLLQRFLI